MVDNPHFTNAINQAKDEYERLEIINREKDGTIHELIDELALYRKFDKELADKIDPAYFANVLSFAKWRPFDYPVKDVLVFQWCEDGNLKYQVMLPCNKIYSDYTRQLLEAAKAFAAFLCLDTKTVLVELVLKRLNANHDIKENKT